MPAQTSHEKAVCLSVRQTRFVTKQKKVVPTFLYHTKDHLALFYDQKNGWLGRPLLHEILGQTDPNGEKKLIFVRYSLVAPQL